MSPYAMLQTAWLAGDFWGWGCEIVSSHPLLKQAEKPFGASSFDMGKAVQQGHFVIASMSQSPWWSHDQKVIVSGFLIDSVLDFKEAEESQVPADDRKRFVLSIDECGEVLGEDLKRAVGAVRKYMLPMVLAAQNLDKFCKGELDMGREVMGGCAAKVVFQQRDDDNLQRIVRCIGHSNIDLTERLVEVQRQRGLIAIPMQEQSIGSTRGRSASSGGMESTGKQQQEQISSNWSNTEGSSDTAGSASSNQWSSSSGVSAGDSDGRQRGSMPIIVDGLVVAEIPTASVNESRSSTHQSSDSVGESKSRIKSSTETESQTRGGGSSTSTGDSQQEGTNWQSGVNEAESQSTSTKRFFGPIQ